MIEVERTGGDDLDVLDLLPLAEPHDRALAELLFDLAQCGHGRAQAPAGRESTVPVLILTAADSVEQRVRGLDLGADDFMAKPFALSELEARARALVRRANGGGGHVLRLGPLSFDQNGRSAYLHGQPLELSARETGLLEALLQRSAGWSARSRSSITCASGATRSATTRSRSTCTGCARSSRAAACASRPCAAWATAWRRSLIDDATG
jgi:CheY-like chemotaxis protein